MHGVKLRGGQHQAIEAKEKVEISQEYRTVASVTFQNLFMMFDKMAGMSGTLMDAKDELFETYGKHVVRIPTNRPLKRVDRKDRYFKNGHDQFWTAVDDVIRLHETGQPVLVVLNSVTDTDLFCKALIEKNYSAQCTKRKQCFLGSTDYRRRRPNECGHGCYNDGRKRNRYKARRRSEGAWRLSCHRYRQDEQFKIREAGEGSRR